MGEKRILVVDADMDVLLEAEASLTARGYLVLATARAEQAALMARSFRPQLVVLSADLHAGHAFEIVEELRLDPRTAEVPVLMSSRAPERVLSKALDADALALVQRPLDDTAHAVIDGALAEKKLRGEVVRVLQSVRAGRLTGTVRVTSKTAYGEARFAQGALEEARFAGFRGEAALSAMVEVRRAEVEFDGGEDLAVELDDDGPWDLAA